jgi:hypothetical protein
VDGVVPRVFADLVNLAPFIEEAKFGGLEAVDERRCSAARGIDVGGGGDLQGEGDC